LQDLQHWLRVHGLSLVILVALALCGMVLARGPVRSAAWLFGGAALVQALIPVATISWGFRYGVPALGALAAAAALGLHALLERAAASGAETDA
jgi:hypothetical protein